MLIPQQQHILSVSRGDIIAEMIIKLLHMLLHFYFRYFHISDTGMHSFGLLAILVSSHFYYLLFTLYLSQLLYYFPT